MEITHPRGPVVLFGASYLRDWPVDRLGDSPVVNRAQSGLTTDDLIRLFPTVVLPERPRAVVFWGADDLTAATPETIERALEQACENIRTLVCLALEHGVEPVLMTELPPAHSETWVERGRALLAHVRGQRRYQDYVEDCLVQLNAFIRRLASREELLLIDAEALFAESAQRDALTTRDGRISPDGYEALTAYAEPVLGFLFGEDEPDETPIGQAVTAWVPPPPPPLVRAVRFRG